jgi:hypothetical protein
MALLLSNQNLLSENFQNKIIKNWSYNFRAANNCEFIKHISCIYNGYKRNEQRNLGSEDEYEYVSFITQNKNLNMSSNTNLLFQLKYEEWINKYFLPIACISESRDYALGVDTVSFLNGSSLIIPHVVCPHLLDYNLKELSLVYFRQNFCENHNLI